MVMPPFTAFTSSLEFLRNFFFFRLDFVAIYLPTKSDCSEIVPCKDLMRYSVFQIETT